MLSDLLLTVLTALSSTLAQAPDWCYQGTCGPKNWAGICRTGKVQSPINIVPSSTTKSQPERSLVFSADYYAVNDFEMINTGKGVTVTLPATTNSNLQVKGAGWNGTYNFLEMNFHWGSEHLVKGRRFPLELQIVHEQTNGKGGKGIIAVLFGVTKNANKALEPITAEIPDIYDVSVAPFSLRNGVNLSALFPPKWDVFRYLGSLTTPPCTEGILWSVFTQRMPISQAQADVFAGVLTTQERSLKRNYRPTFPAATTSRKRIYWMPINKAKMVEAAF